MGLFLAPVVETRVRPQGSAEYHRELSAVTNRPFDIFFSAPMRTSFSLIAL
jgi:hypothetical protein